MKLLLVCVAVLAIANYAQCISSSEEISNMKVNMIKYIQERDSMMKFRSKAEEICPGYGDKFMEASQKAQRCINNIDEDNETLCSTMKNHFETCVAPIMSIFEECLPEKTRDLPAFVVKSVVSVSDYLCRIDGEHIFELSNPCARTYSFRTRRCIRKLETKFQELSMPSSKLQEKADLCSFLSSFKGCVQSHLHASCGNVKTREAFLNLYDAALKPCQTNSMNEVDDMNLSNKWVEEV